jgi:hypothetical protein
MVSAYDPVPPMALPTPMPTAPVTIEKKKTAATSYRRISERGSRSTETVEVSIGKG